MKDVYFTYGSPSSVNSVSTHSQGYSFTPPSPIPGL